MDAADNEADDDPNIFAWEGIYDRPWESVVEAADGSLLSSGSSRLLGHSRGQEVLVGVKRGVLRSVFLIIDASKAAGDADMDMRPSRLAVMLDAASRFVSEFFEQNPISTLAVLATRGGRAEILSEPSCNPREHLRALKLLGSNPASARGDASLQNVLELARESLHSVPSFTSREVLLLSASLSSCDPGDIFQTVAALKRDKLRCSIFSLQAEVFICRKIAADTGGDFGVPSSAQHLRDLLLALVPPRPMNAGPGAVAPTNSLIRVGFPRRQSDAKPTLGFSPGAPANKATLCYAPYRCPQCDAAHTDLPTQCQICQLKLMSSVELTKTYHHLFPVPGFLEAQRPRRTLPGPNSGSLPMVDLAEGPPAGLCFACGDQLPVAARKAQQMESNLAAELCAGFECPGCLRVFCASCDELIHSVLRTCPGCEAPARPTR